MEEEKIVVIRIDYIFSYWIFLWWILYMLKIVKYNPKLAILLGIIENSVILIHKIAYKKYCSLLPFIIINTIIKIIPLLTLLDTELTQDDVIFTCVLFVIHLIWLGINFKETKEFVQSNKRIRAPFENLFNNYFHIDCK